jgi:hypothetical protein
LAATGHTVVGYHVLNMTGGPYAAHLKLTIATNVLTGALSVAPGSGATTEYRVITKKGA